MTEVNLSVQSSEVPALGFHKLVQQFGEIYQLNLIGALIYKPPDAMFIRPRSFRDIRELACACERALQRHQVQQSNQYVYPAQVPKCPLTIFVPRRSLEGNQKFSK